MFEPVAQRVRVDLRFGLAVTGVPDALGGRGVRVVLIAGAVFVGRWVGGVGYPLNRRVCSLRRLCAVAASSHSLWQAANPRRDIMVSA